MERAKGCSTAACQVAWYRCGLCGGHLAAPQGANTGCLMGLCSTNPLATSAIAGLNWWRPCWDGCSAPMRHICWPPWRERAARMACAGRSCANVWALITAIGFAALCAIAIADADADADADAGADPLCAAATALRAHLIAGYPELESLLSCPA